eukprot:463967_1
MADQSEQLNHAKQQLGKCVLLTLASCGAAYIAYRTIHKNIPNKKPANEPKSISISSSVTSITSETTETDSSHSHTMEVSFADLPSPPPTSPLTTKMSTHPTFKRTHFADLSSPAPTSPLTTKISTPPTFKRTHSMDVGVSEQKHMKLYSDQNKFQKQGSIPRLLPMSPLSPVKVIQIPPPIHDSHSTDDISDSIHKHKPIKVLLKPRLKHIRLPGKQGISHPRLFPSLTYTSRSVDPYTNWNKVLTPATHDVTPTPPPYHSAAIGNPTKLALTGTFLGESSYRETVIFLLALATYRLYPNEQLIINNTFKFGTKRRSYFCSFESNLQLDNDLINQIENEMMKLSDMQLELHSKFIDYETCLRMLTKTNQKLSAKLVKSLNRPCSRMVGVDYDAYDAYDSHDLSDDNDVEEQDWSYYILQYRSTFSNTKYCSRFKLHASDDNKSHFVIKFPHNEDSMDVNDKATFVVQPHTRQQPKAIREVYQQGIEMSKFLDINSVSDINTVIHEGRFKELMLISEAYHNRQMVKISSQIKQRRKDGQVKMILISGPSSSGKTTFASKLGIYLHLALGMRPTVVEVDMWFRDRSDPVHPRDAQGNLNFEVIEALKLAEFNVAIKRLLDGEAIRVPTFDFKCGSRVGYHKEKLKSDEENGVIIMEGIFCLNPTLLQNIKNADDIAFKIFICPISPFYSLDNFHFISEQVMRLLRRISRDHFHRGQQADHVVYKWGQLTEGEDINIFPYVKHADAVFNSALLYEISVLKVYSYPLLQTVNVQSKSYKDAQNLIAFLDMFSSMPDRHVPSDSLLM